MKKGSYLHALKSAFPATIPVLLGYLFVGIAFGMLLQEKGYSFIWAILMSVFIYAGSMQFVAINFLCGGFSLLSIAVLTLLINIRHVFYGLTMLNEFKEIKSPKKLYMIFALTDETYALLCSRTVPADVNRSAYLFFIALLDQIYWITGSFIGSVAGSLITFNTTGIDFAMTALFAIILTGQIETSPSWLPAVIGGVLSVICLNIFGASSFILPSMIAITAALVILRGPIEKASAKKAGEVK